MIKNKILLFLGFTCAFCVPSFAQNEKLPYDSNYVETNHEVFGFRLYTSQKYTRLVLNVPDQDRAFVMRPNTGLKMGVGFSYQRLTINVSFPVGFLYREKQQSWPFNLDLNSHIYAPKVIVDLFGQFYGGYKILAEDLANSDEDYLREDMRLVSMGVNVNYLFFGEKLSLGASFNQTATQKRSAFSPFVGFELYGGNMRGDSLLLPESQVLDASNFDRAGYFQAGPNAGLAGTLVFGRGFFVTGTASANLSGGYSKWRNGEEFKKWGVVPTYYLRAFAGYNGKRFSINGNYVYKNLNLIKGDAFDQAVNTGNFRINLVYKFNPGHKFKKGFNKVNPIRIVFKD
ncbi:DUF4421 domain-containing protein [Algoriphagus sp. C2-6-M1]|uniref:DUF4421 domain-containing protein n=1 Tax=Algoriphagus persicinus TaxID=3108754 RepID=UPI002B3DCB8E|nr:DUF4421 domain-containing protein [Algoriphagus sp. C2-6-M1]MEB2782746.1 DUF4421 domain-containing protein [Algoriphagus sp. C2-6-M1]